MTAKKDADLTAPGTDLEALRKQELAALEAELSGDSGAGFEEADRDSYAIPFLKLLQDLSPECDKKQGTAIDGAVSGMFINSATNHLYDGAKGLLVLPVHFSRKFLRWRPRGEGGGFMGSLTPAEVQGLQTREPTDAEKIPKGALVLPDGSFLSDTREHFVLVAEITSDGSEPVAWEMAVVSLSSTQIKKSKRWMSAMQARRLRKDDGTAYCPPMYSMWWKATAMVEKNAQGSWYGWQFAPAMPLTSRATLLEAKGFREAVLSGQAKVADPEQPADHDGYTQPPGNGAPPTDFDDDVGF